MNKGRGIISKKLSIVLLCRKMKWDYYTYLIQPNWFIDILDGVNNVDAVRQNHEAKRIKK